ncbi:MAG: bifunctional 5,10-methylenetetrahydrofolate dehydrogenase/5,10-methenyltetrahydrofolate cyclohydrolase [Phycisphaerae bacterium]
MPARILDGTKLAARIQAETARAVRQLPDGQPPPTLAAVIVGDSSAARAYADSQRRQCQMTGIEYRLQQLPAHTSDQALRAEIERLNVDPRVTGIVLHLPLPAGIDPAAIQSCIAPHKDVEGVNPANIGRVFYGQPIVAPCTALAAMALIRESAVSICGAEAVIVGHSNIVGKPLAILLVNELATVSLCHVATRHLASHTRRADILVVAVGKPRLISAEMVKPGAVVIDVGINRVAAPDENGQACQRLVGDVDFEAVSAVARAITPVPGGVGPVTTAMLLRNTVQAAQQQAVGRRF